MSSFTLRNYYIVAVSIICFILISIGGIFVWWHLENKKEFKARQIFISKEPSILFLALSGIEKKTPIAILYNRIENKIIQEETIDLNGLELGPSGFEAWGSNDSVQYNSVADQILLLVNNVSFYDNGFLTDVPYSKAIWSTSFKDEELPQVIFASKGEISSWITHPDKPVVYLIHQAPNTPKRELLEINLFSKEIRKIADINNLEQEGYYLELVLSKDGNFIYQAILLNDPGRILFRQFNLITGEITVIINFENEFYSIDTKNLSPDEKTFVFFLGHTLKKPDLRIHHLEEQRTEILPMPEELRVESYALWWSADSKKLLLWAKAGVYFAPFIYSLEDKKAEFIDILKGQFPLIWSPAEDYLLVEENGLHWRIFNLKTYKIENVYSFPHEISTAGARWIK